MVDKLIKKEIRRELKTLQGKFLRVIQIVSSEHRDGRGSVQANEMEQKICDFIKELK